MSERDFLLAVCDRLHDACRAFETSRIFMPEDRRCFGPEAHYVDALNVLNAARDQPVEDRMEAMGMVQVTRTGDGSSWQSNTWAEASPSPDLSEGERK